MADDTLTEYDDTALVRNVSKEEVSAFKKNAPEDVRPDAAGLVLARVLLVIVVFVLLASVLLPMFVTAVTGGGQRNGVMLILGPAVLAAAVFAIIGVAASGRTAWKRALRLTEFAAANGFRYAARSGAPSYPGMIFSIGHDRATSDRIYRADSRYREIANYRYVTGSGKQRTTHDWGFLAIQLDRNLPNMVLDSKGNNGFFGMSNLPASLSRSQVLSLEGDFDRYFTLYCPREYERDALYVFTPDLMALLIDEASGYDVEIVDNWMLLYSTTRWDLLDPSTMRRLFTIMNTVGAKTIRQTDYYADDRVANRAANVVAPAGRRLKRGLSVAGIVIGVLFFGFLLLNMLPTILMMLR